MPVLRDYQKDLDSRIVEELKLCNKILVVSATGSGKTVMFSHRVREFSAPTALVVHRKEILGQISIAIAREGIDHRIVAPPGVVRMIRRRHLKEFGMSFVNQNAEVGVISVQTLTAKGLQRDIRTVRWIQRVKYVILDEAHHYVKDGRWGQTLEYFARSIIIGYTATPERSDGKGLGVHADGFAEAMVLGPSQFDQIQNGWAPPFKYHCPKTDLNLSDIPLTASGDVNTRKMRVLIEKSQLVGDIVEQYFQFAPGLPAIVFANDVRTAEEIALRFQQSGVSAVALSGMTDDAVRDREVAAFADGTGAKILVNVDLFDEGFDVPGAVACIMGRVTYSVAKFMQMCGRVSRAIFADGYDLFTVEGRKAAIANSTKPYSIIIDPVSNWLRCGAPTWPRAWTLSSVEKNATRTKKSEDEVKYRVCTNEMCAQPYEAFRKACPHCGHKWEPQGRDDIDKVEGELGELDLEASHALFAKLRKAEMSDKDYMDQLIVRGVPSKFRGDKLRKFQAAKLRRQVLKEYIAWWCGFQPQRGRGELERRFYARFGLDMVTALTLNEKETDAFMERMKKGFQYDIIDV